VPQDPLPRVDQLGGALWAGGVFSPSLMLGALTGLAFWS